MKKITYLEGLRGICCFIVIIDHCVSIYKPDIRYTSFSDIGGMLRRLIAWTPLNIVYSGIAPVCIFFILSGFVLSIKFNKTHEGSAIFNGVVKRYPRLVLPILASMLMSALLYYILKYTTGHVIELGFIPAILEAVYFAPFQHVPLHNYALWTISFEFYGSFIVFGLLAFFGMHRRRLIFYALVFSFLYAWGSFYCLFVFGMILNDLYIDNKFKIHGVLRALMFLIGIMLATSPYERDGVYLYGGIYKYIEYISVGSYRDTYQMLMLTGSMLIFMSILGSSLSEKLLENKLAQFLGRISFPLYVVHVCILNIIAAIAKSYYGDIHMSTFIMLLLVTVSVCLLLSYYFEKYIDLPSIKMANVFAKKIA
ncbi:acyltransferase [Serratia ureilytica]|uniref:acyltransferase family protein n=1 Tax=Serratia ureilytica TaxID=300181 RepID=UPI00254B43F1|nr:acyltransferase [Serratia ureilytica]MDK7595022.1 acyltransferase [Serratia ureilytica]